MCVCCCVAIIQLIPDVCEACVVMRVLARAYSSGLRVELVGWGEEEGEWVR